MGLTCIFHSLTDETRHKAAATSLRSLAVIRTHRQVRPDTKRQGGGQRLAPRSDDLLHPLVLPRGDKGRLFLGNEAGDEFRRRSVEELRDAATAAMRDISEEPQPSRRPRASLFVAADVPPSHSSSRLACHRNCLSRDPRHFHHGLLACNRTHTWKAVPQETKVVFRNSPIILQRAVIAHRNVRSRLPACSKDARRCERPLDACGRRPLLRR